MDSQPRTEPGSTDPEPIQATFDNPVEASEAIEDVRAHGVPSEHIAVHDPRRVVAGEEQLSADVRAVRPVLGRVLAGAALGAVVGTALGTLVLAAFAPDLIGDGGWGSHLLGGAVFFGPFFAALGGFWAAGVRVAQVDEARDVLPPGVDDVAEVEIDPTEPAEAEAAEEAIEEHQHR